MLAVHMPALGEPAPLYSRQGRELQRYSINGERLVAGCIPVRFRGPQQSPASLEVLLVTSSAGKGHVFPKGGWEVDETVEAAAARETVEEAGVRGVLEAPILGAFPYYSSKTARMNGAQQGGCVAHMFVMRVTEELATWPEQGQRQRIWMPVTEAIKSCRHDWMRSALLCFLQRQGWDHFVAQSA